MSGVHYINKGGGTRKTALSIVTACPLTPGTTGVAYAAVVVATGGTAPYTWTISVGALPTGLTLSADGLISGTATGGGTSNFTLQVTDSLGAVATKACSVTFAGATVFSDNFNRANTSYGYGDNWITWQYGYLPDAFAKIDQDCIVGNGFCIGGSGTGYTVTTYSVFQPIVSPVLNLKNFSQFAQATLVSGNNVGGARVCYGGIGILGNWGPTTAVLNGYAYVWFQELSLVSLIRLDAAQTGLVAGVAAVAGDVIRLEGTINAGDVTVVAKVNGVVKSTTVDNNAARSTFGYPIMQRHTISRSAVPGANSQIIFDDFSCGTI